MTQVFVSHVEEDAEVALAIAAGLEAAGYGTWYYERDSLPGLSYLDQIDEAIGAAQVVVLVISPQAVMSWQVDKEVVRAHEAGKLFIPFLRNMKHNEFQLAKPGWRMALGSATSVSIPAEGVGALLPRIIAALKKLGITVGSKVESPPTAPPVLSTPTATPKASAVVKELASEPAESVDWYSVGVVACTQEIAAHPHNADAYAGRATAYRDQGHYTRALADCNEAIRIDPNHLRAHRIRGGLHDRQGDRAKAITDFTTAIRLEPNYPWTYHDRGCLLRKQGDLAAAIADFSEAIRLQPQGADLRESLLVRGTQPPPKAILLQARLADLYNTRGTAYACENHHLLAIADYTESIRLDPRQIEAYVERAEIYRMHTHQFDLAIADYTRAIELERGYYMGFLRRASAYMQTQEYAKALADSSEAIKIDPDFYLAYRSRAWACIALGEYDRAIDDCTESIRRNPDFAAAYLTRAAAYQQKGDLEQARADEETAARKLEESKGEPPHPAQ